MIRTENLVKRFEHRNASGKLVEKTAVNGISLHIKQGEVFGLLGQNGAGKTTTIRMLTMLTSPTEGKIFYQGQEAAGREREVRSLIGVVPQNLNFDQDLTVGENLELHGRLYQMSAAERKQRIAELLEFVDLSDVINDGVKRLSGGMKRRLLIARALMHKPAILFMDEPTVALDPQVRRKIWELIRKLATDGTTVLLTTHYIEEAEALCQRVAIMRKGNIIAENTPAAFVAELGKMAVEWQEGFERRVKFFPSRMEAKKYLSTLEEGVGFIRRANLEDVFMELAEGKE